MAPLSLWSLLGFVIWTLLLVLVGIGIPRVSAVLAGRARPNSFVADVPHGSERYRRAMRAHANCVENLPIFAVLVVMGRSGGVENQAFETLAALVLPARVLQSTVHIASGSNRAVIARFVFFCVQIACFAGMAWMVAQTL